jgi:hypothetical protein
LRDFLLSKGFIMGKVDTTLYNRIDQIIRT